MTKSTFVIGAAALFVSGAAQADDASICADRPGKATATCTVPKGAWQVETAIADWSWQEDRQQREATLIVGDTQIKYGVSDSTDIGIDVSPYVRISSRMNGISETTSGIGDVTVELKHRLTNDGATVQVTMLPFATIPVAKDDVGAGTWQYGLLLPVSYAIPNSALSIVLTPELDLLADADGSGRHPAMAQVAGLGWQASNKLNLSVELWGMWDWDPTGTMRQSSVDASVAYLLSNRVQLDAGTAVGLNRRTPDIELYGGFSMRF